MEQQKRDGNKILVGVLCALTVIMVGLIVAITAVKVGRYSEIADGGGYNQDSNPDEQDEIKEGEGTTAPVVVDGDDEDGGGDVSGEPDETEEEQLQVENQIAIEDAIKQYIRGLSVDDALVYLDGQIENVGSADEKFSMRLIKINVLNNDEQYEAALAEAQKIENVDKLNKWNKIEYYNMMAYTYQMLGDTEKENEYGAQYIQAYKDLWGDFRGSD
ncbi:hypothetical protein IKE19_00245 [Candidatus Saccharibacteria bacterium]|nr:hypothetical protein [Candidatus Saccharibacteria bacterium]